VQRLIADGQRNREDHTLDDKIQVLERLIAAVTEQLQLLAAKPGSEGYMEFATGAGACFPVTEANGQNGRGEE
jgi:hypothetical protein